VSIPVQLRIRRTEEGGWAVEVKDVDRRRSQGALDSDEVEQVTGRVREALAAEGPIAHEVAASPMSWVVTSGGAVSAALTRSQRTAGLRNEDLILVVQPAADTLATLPWELIAEDMDGPPLELARSVTVAMQERGPGQTDRIPGVAVATRWWSGSVDDPVAATMVPLLQEVAEDASEVRGGSTAGAVRTVVHVLIDSRRVGRLGPPLPAPLREAVSHAALVVVHAVGESAREPAIVAAVKAMLLEGAGSVIAPRGPWERSASFALTRALYAAFSDESTLSAAVRRSRRAVRALRLLGQGGRWSSIRWYVGAKVPTSAFVADMSYLAPWGSPGHSAVELLRAAWAAAGRSGDGFAGIEHLALAASRRAEVRVPAAQRSVQCLRRIERLLGMYERREQPAELAWTPRLQRVGMSLPSGFGESDLWSAIAADAVHALKILHGEETSAVMGAGPQDEAAALGLEVLCGPHDGEILKLAAGDVLGRASKREPAAVQLYATGPVFDPRLSRRHLVWRGGGLVELLRPIARPALSVGVPIRLEEGSVVRLTELTNMRVIALPE
jgi:hypothetical protein